MEYVIITLGVIFAIAFVFYKFANHIIGYPIKVKSLMLCAGCAVMLSLVVPRIVVNFAGFLGTIGVLTIIAIICAYFIAYYDNSGFKHHKNIELHCEETLSDTGTLYDSEVRMAVTKTEIISGNLQDSKDITSDEATEYDQVITTSETVNKVTDVAATITYSEKLHKELDNRTGRDVDGDSWIDWVEDKHIIVTKPIEQFTEGKSETKKTSKETCREVYVITNKNIYEQQNNKAIESSTNQTTVESIETINYNDEIHFEEIKVGENTVAMSKQEVSSSIESIGEDGNKSSDDNGELTNNDQTTVESIETINYNDEMHVEEIKAEENTAEMIKQEVSSSIESIGEDGSKSSEDNIESLVNEQATVNVIETINNDEEIIGEINKIGHNVEVECQGKVVNNKDDKITQKDDSCDIIIAPEFLEQMRDVTETIITSKKTYKENLNDDQERSDLRPRKVNNKSENSYNAQSILQANPKINTVEFEADDYELIIKDAEEDSKRVHLVDDSAVIHDGQVVDISTLKTGLNDSGQYIKAEQQDDVGEDFNMSIDATLSDKPTLDELMDYAFKQKESQSFEQSIKAFRQALYLYPECDAAPFLILEIATIQKNAGRLDEAIKTFGEGRRIASNLSNASLEKEFIDAIAYLRIVKNVLVQNDMYCIPYNKIPAGIMAEVDKEFLDWRKLI